MPAAMPDSASNALNKWLHANFRDDIVMHGFRHAMRERLRAVSCPSEMIDQIGGWSLRKVGEGYGEGYVLSSTMLYSRTIITRLFDVTLWSWRMIFLVASSIASDFFNSFHCGFLVHKSISF